jgi:hypothetical protein
LTQTPEGRPRRGPGWGRCERFADGSGHERASGSVAKLGGRGKRTFGEQLDGLRVLP